MKNSSNYLLALFLFGAFNTVSAQTTTFNYTGSVQTYTVPVGVTSITVDVLGAKGGNGPTASGGLGGRVQGIVPVTPGEVLNIYVGQTGVTSISSPATYNGGGSVYSYSSCGTAGTGGGASDIRRTPYSLNDRLVVAGGGGGGGYQTGTGGHGGGLTGQNGVPFPSWPNSGGKGGTPTAGGAAGTACCSCPSFTTAGAFLQGGNGSGDCAGGGGGGGGWYGGGGSCFAGGGGGSSYTGATVTSVVHTQGFQSGNGQIVITPNAIAGSALNFDGINDEISVPNNPSLNISTAITIEAWVYATKNTGIQNVMSKSNCVPNNNSYIFPRTDDGWVNCVVYMHIGGSWRTLSAPYPGLNQWVHLAATYDGSVMRLYVNGALAATSPVYTGGIFVNSNPLTLGNQPGCGNEYFGGSIDECRIWNRALCQSEIQNNRNCEIPTNSTGLVANYHFNQGVAGQSNPAVTTLSDATANANNGTLSTFTLNGTISNWIAPGGVVTGTSCAAFSPSVTVTPLSQTNVACFGNANGAASVSASGSGLTYNWTPGNPTGDGTSSVSGLVAGTYTCTVTDNCGGTGSTTFNITQPAVMSVTATPTNPLCNGGQGSVTATATGGGGGYTFLWSNGQTTATTTGVITGIYTCTVTSANGCTAVQSATVTQPTALTSSATSTGVLCFGGSTGAINLTVSGGTPGYTFLWSTGQTTEDRTNLVAGTYSVTVTDANGCTTTRTVTVTQPASPLSATIVATPVSCNGGGNGALNLTASGGTPGYSFNWGGGITTEDRSGLFAGTYTCTVTCSNGCTVAVTQTVTQPTAISSGAASQVNVSCNGGSNGAAAVIPASGGTGPYSYNWTPGNPTGDGTPSVTGLTAGTWTCTITDANSCTRTQTFNITQTTPLVVSAASQTNISCNGGTNGAAAINTPTGGAGGYIYNWSPGNPTGDGTTSVTGLTAGTWTCTVTDANACVTTQTFNITQPIALSVTGTSTSVSCNAGTNGSASVNPIGGTAPYSYAWSPSGGTNATATGLGAGTYTCLMTDANGCTISFSAAITEPSAIAVTSTSTDVTCFGQNNGSATVSVSGGTSPYTYAWSPTGGTNATATGLTDGLYSCTITDASGCTFTQSVTINEPAILAATTMQTNVSCNGGSNGDAMVMVSGGTGPYTYAWSPSGGTNATASGLASGTYTCTITDANGCTNTQTVNITQPIALTATSNATAILCNGGTTTVVVGVTGGTSPYSGTGTFTVTAGTYSYTVTDANGCTNTTSITVTEPAALAATSSATSILCNGDSATVTVVGAGGTAPYTGEGSFIVAAGTYTYTVTDANGCITTTSITITEPTAISTSVVSVNVGCNGDSTGSIDLTVTGGTAPYTFDWNSGQFTTEDLTNIPAGSYSGVLTDANGCTDGGTIVISEPAVLVASVTTTVDPDSCGAFNGSIDITVTGGTTGYTYLWNTTATTEDLTGVGAGAYSCVVTDTNGCTANVSGNLNDPNAPTVTLALAVDTLCSTDAAFTLTGESPAGGTFSGPGVTAGSFDPAAAGIGMHMISYTFTDINGCSGSTTDSIFVDVCTSSDVWNLTSEFSIYPNPNDGTFTIQTTSVADVMIYDAQGKLVYTQKVQSNVATQMNIVESGMYLVTVIDANGARTSQRVMVTK